MQHCGSGSRELSIWNVVNMRAYVKLSLKMILYILYKWNVHVDAMYNIYNPFPASRSLMPSVFNSNFLIFPEGVLG